MDDVMQAYVAQLKPKVARMSPALTEAVMRGVYTLTYADSLVRKRVAGMFVLEDLDE